MPKMRIESIAFLCLFVWIAWLTWSMFSIFFSPLMMAVVLAVVFRPFYMWLRRWVFGNETIAAFIVTILVFLFVVVPLFWISWQLATEAQNSYTTMQSSGTNIIASVEHAIQTPVQRFVPGFTLNLKQYIGSAVGYIASNIGGLISRTVDIGFETFLMLVGLLYFLIDGKKLVDAVRRMSPLGSQATEALLDNTYQTIMSVMKGTILVGLMKWAVIVASFFVFGIPNFLLWGSVGGIVASVPALGTPFSYIPAVLYLYMTGSLWMAVGVGIVGTILTLLSDNVLTPYFYGRGFTAPGSIVLFAILGGILFFGPTGFIVGPLVLSTFMRLVSLYASVVGEDAKTPVRKKSSL